MGYSATTTVSWYVSMFTEGEWTDIPNMMTSTQKLEISSSIHSPFAYGDWFFNGNASLIESGKLAIGTKLRFTFSYPTGLELIEMCILSVSNGPGPSSSYLQPMISFTLVSPWYFAQSIGSKAYRGSASEIMKQVIDSIPYTFNSKTFVPSKDRSATRYRTYQSELQFLKQRVEPYSTGEDRISSFMYADHRNNFVYTNTKAISEKEPIICIDNSHTHLAAFRGWMEDPYYARYMLYPFAFTFNINKGENNELWNLAKPSLLFNYPLGHSRTAYDKELVDSFGFNADKQFTYITNDYYKNRGYTKTIINRDLQSPDDVINSALHQYTKELMDAQYIDFTCYSNIAVTPGQKLLWYITKPESDDLSIFSQEYITVTTSHVFQGSKATSYITAATTGFVYDKIGTVSGLFSKDKTVAKTPSKSLEKT